MLHRRQLLPAESDEVFEAHPFARISRTRPHGRGRRLRAKGAVGQRRRPAPLTLAPDSHRTGAVHWQARALGAATSKTRQREGGGCLSATLGAETTSMVAELDALRTELMTEMNERTEDLRTESQAQHAAVMERLDGLAAANEGVNERLESLAASNEERFDGLAASYEGVNERLAGLAASNEERFDGLATTIAEVKTTNEELKEEFRHLGVRFGLLEVRVGQLDARIGQINNWKTALLVGGMSGITVLARSGNRCHCADRDRCQRRVARALPATLSNEQTRRQCRRLRRRANEGRHNAQQSHDHRQPRRRPGDALHGERQRGHEFQRGYQPLVHEQRRRRNMSPRGCASRSGDPQPRQLLVQAARYISVPSGPIPICAAGVNATRERGRTTRRSVPLTTPLVPSSVRPGGRLEAALSA